DFTLGRYRLISSNNQVPFREDIIRTIKNGMPGTSMLCWMQLGDANIEAVADHVLAITKTQLRQTLTDRLTKQKKGLKNLEVLVEVRTTPDGPCQPGPEPTFNAADLEKVRPLFNEACSKCHGEDGAGMENPEWKTDEGFSIASRNFRAGIYKGGGRG